MLKVQPFVPHQLPGGVSEIPSEADIEDNIAEEMTRVKERLIALRSHIYFCLNESIVREMEKLRAGSLVSRGQWLANPEIYLPSAPSIADLLKVHCSLFGRHII